MKLYYNNNNTKLNPTWFHEANTNLKNKLKAIFKYRLESYMSLTWLITLRIMFFFYIS